jgi:hypothetical protein
VERRVEAAELAELVGPHQPARGGRVVDIERFVAVDRFVDVGS